MDIVLVRHAIPIRVENADGPADPALAELGHRQAAATAEWLAPERFDLVLSSPLRRALETAEPISKAVGVPMEIDESFVEYDRDSTSYIHYEEVKAARDPRFAALVSGRWDQISTEGLEFVKRVRDGVDRLVAENPGRRVLVVCHGGVINVALSHILGLDRDLFFEPVYCSVSRIVAARMGIRSVVSINETGHLRGVAPG